MGPLEALFHHENTRRCGKEAGFDKGAYKCGDGSKTGRIS